MAESTPRYSDRMELIKAHSSGSDDHLDEGPAVEQPRFSRSAKVVTALGATAAVAISFFAGAKVDGWAGGFFNRALPPAAVSGENISNTEVLELKDIADVCSTNITFAHDRETGVDVDISRMPDMHSRVAMTGTGEAIVCTPTVEKDPVTDEVTREYITAIKNLDTGELDVTVDVSGTYIIPRWNEERTVVAWGDGKKKNFYDSISNAVASVPFVDRIVDTAALERTIRSYEAEVTAQIRQDGLDDFVDSCMPELSEHTADGLRDAVYNIAKSFNVDAESTTVTLTGSGNSGENQSEIGLRVDYGSDSVDPDSPEGRYKPRKIAGGNYTVGEFTDGERTCEVSADNLIKPEQQPSTPNNEVVSTGVTNG